MSKFVHLHTHSHYSLLDGMSKIPDLVAKTKDLGMDALAITDHGNLYGAVEFYKAAKKAGIKPILGIEAYIALGDHKDKNGSNRENRYFHLTLLAENLSGWKNILKLTSQSWIEGFYYKPRMDKEMLRAHSEGIIALSGCLGGEVSQHLLKGRKEEAEKVVREHQEIFGKDNYFIEIGKHPLIPEVTQIYADLIALSEKTGAPLVVTQDSHYLEKEDKETHDILLAIQTGKTVHDPKKFTLTCDFSFTSPEQMAKTYSDIPEALENTVKIAARCNVELNLNQILLPKFSVPNNKTADEYLRQLVDERISSRYKEITPEVQERVNYELKIVGEMGFSDYFLIVSDFIIWAKERGIVVGPGRGSAAGSIVSYILGITDLDPIHYGLLFERFLNPSRIQMPDIDIDITDIRRDEVFGYLQEKYGEAHVAHIITFGTMAARAAIRDVGRALDIEYGFCDQLAKLIPFGHDLTKAMKTVSELKTLYNTDKRAKQVIDSAKRLEGVARHASVHACGIVLTEKPLVEYIPLQIAPQKDNITVTQFEMHAVEDLGLLKIDLLGLKNLTIIENTIRTAKERLGVEIDLNAIPLDDQKTFACLQKADTTGVFQLESGGMRRYLRELKPTEFEDIIAMVALYRPGPLEAGMVPQYIARKHGKEPVTYLHPNLKPILQNTYGIGIYQEQMMKIATDLGGFTLAEADTLRKAIGKKIKKLLDEQEGRLIQGFIERGIDPKAAQAIWDLFPSFARYGFNRSHAAAYALIAYRTAYLKANYPVAFMTALFNADSGDVERMSFLISESKKMNIVVLPPDINKSEAQFTPEIDNIRFGLDGIKNVGTNIVAAIIEERTSGGAFESFTAFISRIKHKDLNKKSLESLAKCGALDGFDLDRNRILKNIEVITNFIRTARKEDEQSQGGLFGADFSFAPSKKALQLEDAEPATVQEKLSWEKELLGLYVSEHPLQVAAEKILAMKATTITAMLEDKSYTKNYRLAGMITRVKSIITKTGKPMAFVQLEDTTGTIDTVVFSDLFAQHQNDLTEGTIVGILGKLSFRNGEISVIVDQMKKL